MDPTEIGLPDTPLRILNSAPPPVVVRWLDYRDLRRLLVSNAPSTLFIGDNSRTKLVLLMRPPTFLTRPPTFPRRPPQLLGGRPVSDEVEEDPQQDQMPESVHASIFEQVAFGVQAERFHPGCSASRRSTLDQARGPADAELLPLAIVAHHLAEGGGLRCTAVPCVRRGISSNAKHV